MPDSILYGKGILKYTLNRTRMLLFSASLTISQSDVNICFTCMFPFIAYDSPVTYDGIYAPNLMIMIWNFLIFLLLHLRMSQVSFLICLTFGVKCKLWQATYLVLLLPSHQCWEMSLHYLLSVFSVSMSFSFRVSDSFSFIH